MTTLPILRPLIGFHKEEITLDAQRIGTYETSIIPDEDCCTLFTPRYPTTGARPGEAEVAEAELDVAALVDARVAEASVEEFRFPMRRLGAARDGGMPTRPIDDGGPRVDQDQETTHDNHTGQAGGHEGRLERARRDRRGGHGSARLAAEGAGQGKGRRRHRRDDGGVQVARDRSADAARQRDPARSRMGPAGVAAPREERRPAARVREDRLRQDRSRAACRICSTTGPCAA